MRPFFCVSILSLLFFVHVVKASKWKNELYILPLFCSRPRGKHQCSRHLSLPSHTNVCLKMLFMNLSNSFVYFGIHIFLNKMLRHLFDFVFLVQTPCFPPGLPLDIGCYREKVYLRTAPVSETYLMTAFFLVIPYILIAFTQKKCLRSLMDNPLKQPPL